MSVLIRHLAGFTEFVGAAHAGRRLSLDTSGPSSESVSMTFDTVAEWHELSKSRNTKALDSLLHENVVFFSPVVHTPQIGKAVTFQYLSAAFHVLFNESFRYVRELKGANEAVLEFQVEIDGISINGVDMIKWDGGGKIIEFKVMLRPLKAVHLIHQKMAAMLQANP
jgi:hypothetical protein